MTDLTQFVNEKLAVKIYEDPERAFGGTWRRASAAQRCKEHLLTDGHEAHDFGGSYIRYNKPYKIVDGSDSSSYCEIVKFYQRKNGIDSYIDAVKRLAALYDITYDVPTNWQPSAEYIQTQKNREEDIDDVAAMAAFTPDNSREAEYLRARGITDELRRDNDIFAVNEQTEPILDRIRKRHRGTSSSFPKGVRAHGSHTIATPIYEHGHIVAFYFRTLSPDVTPKYLAWNVEKDTPIMFGLRRASPTARRSLVLVEGVFDVIAAQAAIGRDYDVAGYLSSSLKDRQAALIAQAGYRNVIQIVDFDGVQKTENTLKFVRSTAKTLAAEGLTSLVVDLIDETHPDVKQDSNSFIQQFGEEAFTARVKAAQHGTRYIVNGIARAAANGTDEERSDARRDIKETLAIEPSADIINDILARDGSPTARLFGDIDNLRTQLTEERQRLIEKAAEEERRRAIADKYAEVSEHARKGEYEEAKKCADEARRLIDGKSKSSDKLALWLTPITRADIIEEYRGQGGGLVTRWRVATNGKPRTPIVISTGAVTAFTAPTKHGKTKALTNVALMYIDEAKKHNKRVAIIHNEESRGDEVVNLINVLANVVVDPNNRAFIRRCVQEEVSTGQEAIDEARERIFQLIEDGTLVIVSHKPTIEEVEEAVTAGANEFDAIIYDYIQRSRTDDAYISTKDKIKHVMDILNDLAAKTGLPIVTASQFNRQCSSPTDMDLNKNAEASDIEWTLSKCIGLFSSLRRPVEGALFYIEAGDNGKLAGQIVNAGFNVMDTEHPSMYMRILADREGLSDTWGVMEYNGNTGYIGLNRQELWQ